MTDPYRPLVVEVPPEALGKRLPLPFVATADDLARCITWMRHEDAAMAASQAWRDALSAAFIDPAMVHECRAALSLADDAELDAVDLARWFTATHWTQR